MACLQPQNPAYTGKETSENTTHKLEGHDNQPHPPKHSDESPFQNHETSSANPSQAAATLANTLVQSITELLDSESARSVELNAHVLGIICGSPHTRSK